MNILYIPTRLMTRPGGAAVHIPDSRWLSFNTGETIFIEPSIRATEKGKLTWFVKWGQQGHSARLSRHCKGCFGSKYQRHHWL